MSSHVGSPWRPRWRSAVRAQRSRATLALCLVMPLVTLSGEHASAHAVEARELAADVWNTRHGLPQNTVTDLAVMSDGYLWLTTFGGIARFDGVRFDVFRPARSGGLRTSRFLCLAESPTGDLWFGADGGGLFRYSNGAFNAPAGAELERIWVLSIASNGDVWAGGDSGIFRVNADGRRVRRHTLGPPVYAFWRTADDRLLSGGKGDLRCLDGPCDSASLPKIQAVVDFFEEPAGSAYAWADGGAVPIGPTASPITVRSPVTAVDVFTDTARWEGDTWITAGPSVTRLRDGRTIAVGRWLSQDEHGGQAPARALYADTARGLWIGTDGAGLIRLRERHANPYGQPSVSVKVVAEGPGGRVWFDQARTGLAIVENGAWHPAPAPFDQVEYVEGLGFAENGTAWLVGQVNAQTGIWRQQRDRLVQASAIKARGPVVPGAEDRLWIGSDAEGLFYVQGGSLKSSPSATEGPARPIREDDTGRLWLRVGARETRTLNVETGRLERMGGLDPTIRVRDVLTAASGELTWLATYGNGLLWVRNQQVQGRLTRADGLCEDVLSRLLRTPDGRLWSSGNRGVAMVEESALLGAVAGDSKQLRCRLVEAGEANGRGGIVASWGTLFLPTIQSLEEIHPGCIRPHAPPPPSRLRTLVVDGKDVLAGELSPRGGEDISATFTGFEYDAPRDLRFRYRLAGHDRTWSAPTDARTAHFSSVPPGTYRFEVQARGSEGIWGPVASHEVVRRSEWWEPPWVRYGLPAALIFYILATMAWRLRLTRRLAASHQRRLTETERLAAAADEAHGERLAVEVELAKARRLEALGRLAAGVAHDFNNLLTAIFGHADELTGHHDPTVREEALGIRETVERAAGLTRKLLVFGRNSHVEPQAVNLAETVEGLQKLLRRLIREDIGLEVQLRARPTVRVDPSRLEQIIVNLCLNARDAIGSRGTIQVEVAVGQAPDPNDLRAGGWLWVTDNGEGITDDVKARMLEPYFSTKHPTKGSGLGLATVHGAVQEAEGRLTVDSQVGHGTTVGIWLPAAPAAEARPATAGSEKTTKAAAATVLICDDEPGVLRMMTRSLARAGFQTRPTASPAEALECARSERVDILLTDVIMPDMSGPELARRIRAFCPGLPVLFVSGHPQDMLDSEPELTYLTKPFTPKALVARLRAELGSRPTPEPNLTKGLAR